MKNIRFPPVVICSIILHVNHVKGLITTPVKYQCFQREIQSWGTTRTLINIGQEAHEGVDNNIRLGIREMEAKGTGAWK